MSKKCIYIFLERVKNCLLRTYNNLFNEINGYIYYNRLISYIYIYIF